MENKTAFFDIETKYLFDDIHPGFNNLPFSEKKKMKGAVCQKLGLATACIITDGSEPKVFIFDEGQEKELVTLLKGFEKIVGHNLLDFDYLVLEKHLTKDELENLKSKTLDTFEYIKSGTNGQWVRLDDLAKLNLGKEKSEDSMKVPKMWRDGKKDEVRAYCKNDVELAKEIYFFGKNNKKIKYYEKDYGIIRGIKELSVDW